MASSAAMLAYFEDQFIMFKDRFQEIMFENTSTLLIIRARYSKYNGA